MPRRETLSNGADRFRLVSITLMYAGKVWLNLYYVVFSIASIILLIRYTEKLNSSAPEHRDANILSYPSRFFS